MRWNETKMKEKNVVKKSGFLLWGLLLLTEILMSTGCLKKQNQYEEIPFLEATTQETVTQTENKEWEESDISIAGNNWKVEDYPVAGTDNLYEMNLEELSGEATWISSIKVYGNELLVLAELESEETFLYIINPLSVEITASIKLPAGRYSADGVQVREDGEIEICNMERKEFYIYNEELMEQEQISLGDIKTNEMILTRNQMYVYYLNGEDDGIYQYQVENKKTTRIFEDIEGNAIIDLLKDGTCLLFQSFDKESEQNIYEIRNIATGESLYKDSAELWGIETVGKEYVARHYEEGLQEILYGKEGEKRHKVLSLQSYEEYDNVDVNLKYHSVVSGKLKADAKENYNVLVEENKAEELAEENQQVSLLTLNQYNLETGKRHYTMDFYYIHNQETYLSGCQSVYLQDAGCIVIYVEGTEARWLVWDVTKKSSLAEDEANYLYDWQNPEQPDKAALERLRTRATKIGNAKGVDIYFGADIINCPKDIYTYQVSNNAIRIDKMLTLLEKALDKYPEGMLGQLEKNGNSRLQIYLAGGIIPTNKTGIKSIGIENIIDHVTFLVLDMNQFSDLENTIYHEIFHAVEQHLNRDKLAFFDYEVWNTLNPEDFEYDFDYQVTVQNYNFDYTVEDMEREAYFVDNYSKSFPNEDRARIMEFAMLDDGDIRKQNVEGERIQKKLAYICEQIRKGFDTTGWPKRTFWEKAMQ